MKKGTRYAVRGLGKRKRKRKGKRKSPKQSCTLVGLVQRVLRTEMSGLSPSLSASPFFFALKVSEARGEARPRAPRGPTSTPPYGLLVTTPVPAVKPMERA